MVLIAIGVIAVLYAIVQLVILPLINSRAAKTKKMEETKAKWEDINREVERAPRIQKEHRDVVTTINDYSEKYVIRPTLGTYLIGVQSMLETMCTNTGVQIDSITEIGEAEVPGKNKDGSPHALKSYSVRLIGFAGFTQITNFIGGLEGNNRMASLTELQVIAREDAPEQHRISCVIQWPVWAEADKGTDPMGANGAATTDVPADAGIGAKPAKKVWE